MSGSGVRSIWVFRHGVENFKKRLQSLEAKVAAEGILLTNGQIAALERKKLDDEACGEFETLHPGHLGSQDTFYVGNLRGVGRIYQQTLVDTYNKIAFAKLYTSKTPITSADILNDRVLPFFEPYQLPMPRILTDRGIEYCGRMDQHNYQLYLAVTILITPKPKYNHRKQKGFASASIRRFRKSSIRSHSAKNFTLRWMRCKRIWTNG